MLAIVISACLVADPNVCRDHRIPISMAVDSMHCMTGAQPHFAKWAAEHPGWQIRRWRCASSDTQDL